MTITDELPPAGAPAEPPHDPPEPPQEPALRRRANRRLVAGVAGGVADRFDIDVTVVRVAFVVLACLWGLGVVIYLALWALVPLDGQPADPAEDTATVEAVAGPPWLTYLLLTGALFIGLIFSSAWWGGPRLGGGAAVIWLALLFGIVVVSLRRPRTRLSVGRVLAVLTLVAISLLIVVSGAFFGVVALTGVPLRGGIGQRMWQPTSVSEVQSDYRLAVGSMTVDLTHVAFGPGTHALTASVGVGLLVVDVPSGVIVDVDAHSGIGTVSYGADTAQSFAVPPGSASAGSGRTASRLDIDAQVGIGRIELQRSGSPSVTGLPAIVPPTPPPS